MSPRLHCELDRPSRIPHCLLGEGLDIWAEGCFVVLVFEASRVQTERNVCEDRSESCREDVIKIEYESIALRLYDFPSPEAQCREHENLEIRTTRCLSNRRLRRSRSETGQDQGHRECRSDIRHNPERESKNGAWVRIGFSHRVRGRKCDEADDPGCCQTLGQFDSHLAGLISICAAFASVGARPRFAWSAPRSIVFSPRPPLRRRVRPCGVSAGRRRRCGE